MMNGHPRCCGAVDRETVTSGPLLARAVRSQGALSRFVITMTVVSNRTRMLSYPCCRAATHSVCRTDAPRRESCVSGYPAPHASQSHTPSRALARHVGCRHTQGQAFASESAEQGVGLYRNLTCSRPTPGTLWLVGATRQLHLVRSIAHVHSGHAVRRRSRRAPNG